MSVRYLTVNRLLRLISYSACVVFIGLVHCVSASDLRFNSLTIADGLTSEYINETFQQQNGFIWFATNAGASRYDGHSFRHFSYAPGKPSHITNNVVIQIFEDQQNNIWILTEGGLNKINPQGNIEYFVHDASDPNSINANWMHYIYQDSSDRIWIATNKGLNLYHPERNEFSHFSGTIKDTSYQIPVNQMIETSLDNFILATMEGLVFFNSSDSSFSLESDKNNDVPEWYTDTLYTLTRLESGRVLIGTFSQGLIDYDPISNDFQQYRMNLDGASIAEDWISSALERSNGELIIGHEFSGLTIISENRQDFTHIKARDFDETSLISDHVNHVFEDQSGLIWVATESGVSKHSFLEESTSLLHTQADNKGLSGNIVYNTAPIDEEQMLIASSGGLNKLQLSDTSIEHIDVLSQNERNILSDDIYDVSRDSQGLFWLVSANGIHQYDPVSNEVINYLNSGGNTLGLPDYELWTSLVDSDDAVWVTGNQDVGLVKFDPDKGVVQGFMNDPSHLYITEGDYTADKIMAKNGDIWLATTDGVYRINPQTGLEQHIRLGSTDSELMRTSSISLGMPGEIWVTTLGAGLVKLTLNKDNTPELTRFTTEEGLIGNELLTVAKHQDKLWLTTRNKIFSYDPITQNSVSYPSLLNLPGIDFVEGSQTVLNDTLYLGTNKGLLIVKLDKVQSNNFNSPVQITQVKAGKSELMLGLNSNELAKAFIPYEDNNISFSYAALDYTNPSANRYRYFLQGFDDEWMQAGTKLSTNYNNLSAGTYTFKVVGTNSDGLWSDQIASFTFEIKQPWWFYALWVLACALAIGLLLFFINRRLHVKTLHKKANYDSLTGLANRYNFNNHINNLVTSTDNSFALVMVDLDRFKEVNDIYGHAIGDELLIQAAYRMKQVLRDDDFLARLGGDEFALIINLSSQPSELLNILERLRQVLESGYTLNDHMIRSTASIGAASFPADANETDSLLVYADTAMFAAKECGRNAIRFFNESLSDEIEKRTKLRQKLKIAVENEEFELYFQPQIDHVLNKTVGFEALIRWFQADGDSIPPDIFIPEAERNGSIVELGRWVLHSACKQAAKWHDEGLFSGTISVNVSASQITKSDLVSDVKKALEENKLSPEQLELEITESVLVDNIDLTLKVLIRLKELGVSIALDDFGTGYSSLNYLTRFPIDTLKIDRSFIQSVEADIPTKMVLKNIYSLASDLSMSVVAEGVETHEQLEILLGLQARFIQGYYFSRPLNVDDATQRLRSQSNV